MRTNFSIVIQNLLRFVLLIIALRLYIYYEKGHGIISMLLYVTGTGIALAGLDWIFRNKKS